MPYACGEKAGFHYTAPLQKALLFVGFVIIVDFLLVALVINHSLAMFASLLGTWIPFALIFASTYLTGWYLERGTFPSPDPSARIPAKASPGVLTP